MQNSLNYNAHDLYAIVIIPLALPINYTWSVPMPMQANIKVGQRVEVALRNKKYAGVVKQITTQQPQAYSTKDILSIIDEQPIIYPQQLQLWEWLAQYYMCTEGEIMQAALPTNLKLNSETLVIWNDELSTNLLEVDLTDSEYLLAEALQLKGQLKFSEVQQILSNTSIYKVIKGLLDKDICYVFEELRHKYKPKTENIVTLSAAYATEDALSNLLNHWSKAPKQLELLLAYLHIAKTEGEVNTTQLLKKANANAAQLKGLIDKKILLLEKRNVDRVSLATTTTVTAFQLSDAQQKALQNIQQQLAQKEVCLLHGVTASGKTEVYIKLIEQYMASNNQILFLLPEIALTTQIIKRLQKYFGSQIAIYHSKFNANERVEIWNKVYEGTVKIVLGARSALYLPYKQLQLIIIDEEHDSSYKQTEPAPRYHTRDAAIYYANICKAKVLLGSATPSIETYYNCMQKKYGLVALTERYANVSLPEIELIDLKQFTSKTEKKIALTPPMTNALHQSIGSNKQAILFQNRRGYSPYTQCTQCGWIPHCKHCDVTLTYHKSKNKLSCHYCSTTYPVLTQCMACGKTHFTNKNFGTEKLEETVAEALPKSKVARMDWDTVKGKYDHENLIKQFEQHKIDVLVGTQMVVKGLDFEHVDLVGIVDADGILNFSDFRANERAFQLMEQVSGRAGRKNGKGKVLIQVSNTQHPVLQFVKEHNYQSLYNFEIDGRQLYNYPPFARIINITVKHKQQNTAYDAAEQLLKYLQPTYQKYINGSTPAKPPVDRIRNQYLFALQIKLPKQAQYIQGFKQFLLQQIVNLKAIPTYKAIAVVVDVDPL